MFQECSKLSKRIFTVGVAVYLIPPEMSKLTYLLRFWGKKQRILSEIHQTPRIFNQAGESAKWENVKF